MSNPVETALAAITEHMDPSTGMYPADWACRACGKTLNADGMHPAELYAGTFTGLCYGCERSGSYVVPGSELPDGGRLISHPPASPSWRRDRTTHWAYPDCEECGGKGARMRYSNWGQYLEYCRPCMTRVMAPRRANEIKYLRTIAGALEMVPLRELPAREPLTAVQTTVSEACTRVSLMAGKMFTREPTVWKPQSYLLSQAESRLKPAQLRAKRTDTLRRHLVAALRAEADAIEAKSTI